MKRIIDGKVYNTETAERVCDISSTRGLSVNDFKYEDTYLYRTKKGNWFIAGEGHAMSRWAKKCGDMYGWGDGLSVIDEDEARDYVERYGNTDDYERLFGAPEEA